MINTDVVIIGASASGLMCAIEAGKRGRNVTVLDHANKAGKKILMSGGGRCNFTNYDVSADNYISHNPHFCKSALSRFTQWDFLELVKRHQIPFHEREHGQLFCDDSAKDILDMLLSECKKAGVTIRLNTEINSVQQLDANSFQIKTSKQIYQSQSLVIASGGLSIPKMCASPLGYKIAQQFGIKVWPTNAGLVPFTLQPEDKELFSNLSGIAIDSLVHNQRTSFRENILFTHRGLSGPAILQISSYWRPGEAISINLLPDIHLNDLLLVAQQQQDKKQVKTWLAQFLPKRVIATLLDAALADSTVNSLSHKQIDYIAACFQTWIIKPNGTEGYRTAEVTLGGVDCDALSSKTMEARNVAGLYFIGEVVDVTGWLGGYNFQWAWSSGWCAGQVV
ncbi:MAG: NAD(P)/FAD-dependent oxidoreductase [Gammaproteobacteria bacterium]|nr:NAD(P)/FAD-dependent oxidoreductase [Gammaproteobacteria bacterium]